MQLVARVHLAGGSSSSTSRLGCLEDDGGGESSRFLGNFTPLLLLNGLFGRQGVLLLRLRFLQLGLIEAGDFPHVWLLKVIHGVPLRAWCLVLP